MTPYFGTTEPLPATRTLRAGNLTLLYERGNLRYIRLGRHELVRMIYPAVRDHNWMTAPYQIDNEHIQDGGDSFQIRYTARYELDAIRYEADFEIDGKSESTIRFSMRGRALTSFRRNRIGLCVLHPIAECAGKPVRVQQPDGGDYEGRFPETISPHQPLRNIRQLTWQPIPDVTATLRFEGDVFETEDQRNWTDHSYKTYSTPLDRPFPVLVQTGDTVEQEVTLTVTGLSISPANEPETGYQLTGRSLPFPRVGHSRSEKYTLTDRDIAALQKLSFEHYRTEIRLGEDWKPTFERAIAEAQRLATKLELVVFFSENWESELATLEDTLTGYSDLIYSLLPLQSNHPTISADRMQRIYSTLKASLPDLQIGYGTDGFFADLNRNRPADVPFDFVSFSITPQVHASDTRSVIENVSAQRYALETATTFANGKPVHISPVTLKIRHKEETVEGQLPRRVDVRQPSELAAAFTLLCLRYLAGAGQVTLYETVGMGGLLAGEAPLHTDFPARNREVFPVYDMLKRLADFKPVRLLETIASNPLHTDYLAVENASGERLTFFVDFEKAEIRVEV